MVLKSRLLQAFVVLALTTVALPASAAQPTPGEAEAESMIAAISGAAGKLGRQAGIPTLISHSDEALYRSAFEAQQHNQWAAADHAIDRLSDDMLVGHLLAERYLSGAYHAQPQELADWMSGYADLPEAQDIYDMAKQRLGKTAGLKPPAHPEQGSASPNNRNEDTGWEDFSVEGNRQASAADRRRVHDLKDRFRDEVREHSYDSAAAMLDGPDMLRAFDKADYDECKTVLALAMFKEGRDAEALKWAEDAAERSGDALPEAHWLAGLVQWRSGKHADSARHFEAVGNAVGASTWLVSAGSYWAARANLAAKRPDVVNHWLQQAAAYPRNFYGVLARRALGQDVQYSWEEGRPFTDMDAESLSRVPGARRALALLQIGDKARAEEELRYLAPSAGPAMSQSLLALAHAGGMPGLAVRLGGLVGSQDGRSHDSAAYPVPDWHPTSGWSIDKALVLAIARQESAFNPRAKSPAGATGLMQLMPRTAKAMGAKGNLTDPQVNLELGQRYVRRLLDDDTIKSNLLFLAASYNSGPGNVARWLQTIHHNGDALLFMESIPARETRAFVGRVMTNFWAYRNRLGQDSPSLDAIAAGDWPMYDGAESKIQAVKYVKN
jgi:soluble lytic murein transglycosylase-like protein